MKTKLLLTSLCSLLTLCLVACGEKKQSTTENASSSTNTTNETTKETATTDFITSESTVEESTTEVTKTIFGTWKGNLTGYDEEGELNYDDVTDLVVVLNDDLTGSYNGTSVTWTTNVITHPTWYRYVTDSFQFWICDYSSAEDKVTVRWESMEEGDYKTGEFSRQ